jgi:cytochrome b involved in lipid metabolism
MFENSVFLTKELAIFKSEQSVRQFAEKRNLIMFIYNDKVYDCTNFQKLHPGMRKD